jgi:hypothetical protein
MPHQARVRPDDRERQRPEGKGRAKVHAARGIARAVGIRRDPAIDIGRLLGSQVAGLPRHQPRQIHPHLPGLDPLPQPRQPVAHVEGVGHQPARRDRRHPQPGTQLGGGELGDLRSAHPTGPADLLPTRPGRLSRVHGGGVVEVGVLQRDPEDRHLQPTLGGGQHLGMVERLARRQLLQLHHIHMPTLT